MRLGTRSAIQTAILSLIAIIITTLVLNSQLRQHAIAMAEHEAQLIIAERLATVTYVTNDLHPAITSLMQHSKNGTSSYDPALMSAGYVNRMIMKYFGKAGGEGYYFKNAAIDARNPDNEADQSEADFLRTIGNNPEAILSEVKNINGKPFFIHMQPNPLRFTEECMQCHSIPENAPETLLSLYGRKRSFNKTVGEIPSIMSIRIPLNEQYFHVHPIAIRLSIFLGCLMSVILMVQWFITRKEIFRPLARITDKAIDITNDGSKLGEKIVLPGKGELSEMAEVFSNMSVRLFERRKELEGLVDERTRQLNTANNLLEESEQHFRALFQNAPLPYQSLDVDGHLLEVNNAWLETLGYSKEEVIGNSIEKVMTPEMQMFFRQRFPLFKEEGAICGVEFELQKKDTSTIMAQFVGRTAYDANGNFRQTHCIFRDITREVQIENENRVLEKQLRQALKMEAIGTLAGGIAHDFNNILAAIIGYAEMAREDIPESSQTWKDINEVLIAGRRARDLVKHILSFSRMSEYDDMITVDLAHLMEEVLELLRASIPTTITITKHLDHRCGNILADPTQIHQVLMNICTNAAHAMDDDGGTMTVSLCGENLTEEDLYDDPSLEPGAYLKITVADTGCGIQPEIIDKIFDPYFTTKSIGKGSGMGLAMVHGIVNKHGGMVRVESKPGKGTAFHIYFPLISTEQLPEAYHDETPIKGGTERILVVDDEKSITTVIQQRLQKLGYQVTTETSSKNAFELFQAAPDSFDLIITDQTMPEMTGEMLTRNILAIREDIPIILCTGYSSKVDQDKARDIGMKAFIMKPVEKRSLAYTVRRVLDESGQNN